jgi:cytidylate kinase
MKLPLRPTKGPIITIGGLHGVGKSTYGRRLAEAFGLDYVSTGTLFRELAQERGLSIVELSDLSATDPSIDHMIDESSKRLMAEGDVLFDSLLAGYFAKEYESFRIYLWAPPEVRMARIASREGKGLKAAEDETLLRERRELERFKRYYGIDVVDTSVYHLVLDTSLLSLETNLKILSEAIACYLEEKWSDYVRYGYWKDLRQDARQG